MAFAAPRTSTQQPNSQESSSHSTQDASCTPLRHHDKGPWPNYNYPSKWEINDDFMCVHFIPKTADKATWDSQCTFWNEAISLYAEQLLYKCPLKYNRLSFTPSDIKRVYQRQNRLVAMCIIDIIKWMKYKKKSVILASYLEDKYNTHSLDAKHDKNPNNHSANNSLLSSMMNSMIGYLMSNTNSDDDDDENETDYGDPIVTHTKVLYTPIVDELCDRMCHLQFYHSAATQTIS
eukprot:152000_1